MKPHSSVSFFSFCFLLYVSVTISVSSIFLYSTTFFLSHLSHSLSSSFDYNKELKDLSKFGWIHLMHFFIHPFIHSTNVLTPNQSLC